MKQFTLAIGLLLNLVSPSCAEEMDTVVTVDVSSRYQTVEGFGASVNGWTAPLIPLYYETDFADYAANELGMSVFRLQMWGGVSTKEVEDWREISYRDFRWKGAGLRGKVNVDWAKAMVRANPEVKIIGSIWSPPGWMKRNGTQEGTASGYLFDEKRDYDSDNLLKKDRYQHFAKWVVEWARYMETQGTPFYAISLQNELVFTQWFESAMYGPDEYAEIVRVTGEMFESEQVRKPLFFGPEDMTMATYEDVERHRPYVDALMKSGTSKYFDVFATHGYTDGVASDSKHSSAAYWESVKGFGRPYWITEGGTGKHEWPSPLLNGIAPRLHYALVDSNVSLFCGWQLSGEIGRSSEHDFMSYDRPTKKTYAAMHYWRHIRPGAIRIETLLSGESEGLLCSSFHDTQRRQVVFVVLNQSERKRDLQVPGIEGVDISSINAYQTSEKQSHEMITLKDFGSNIRLVHLPALSITSLIWNLQ